MSSSVSKIAAIINPATALATTAAKTVSTAASALTGSGTTTVNVEDSSDGVYLTEAEQSQVAASEAKRKARAATSGTSTVLTSPLGTTSSASTITKTLGA